MESKPDQLKTGYTTGACAAAAAKAAVLVLFERHTPMQVEVAFPDGTRGLLPVLWARRTAQGAEAAVVKDAGDDPDVTHRSTIIATGAPTGQEGVMFAATNSSINSANGRCGGGGGEVASSGLKSRITYSSRSRKSRWTYCFLSNLPNKHLDGC